MSCTRWRPKPASTGHRHPIEEAAAGGLAQSAVAMNRHQPDRRDGAAEKHDAAIVRHLRHAPNAGAVSGQIVAPIEKVVAMPTTWNQAARCGAEPRRFKGFAKQGDVAA